MLLSPLRNLGLDSVRNKMRNSEIFPPKYSWEYWPGLLLLSSPSSLSSLSLFSGSGICQENSKTKDFHHQALRAVGERAPGSDWNQFTPNPIPGVSVEQAPEGEGNCGCFQIPPYLLNIWEISGIQAKMPELFSFQLSPSHLDFPAHCNLNWFQFHCFEMLELVLLVPILVNKLTVCIYATLNRILCSLK